MSDTVLNWMGGLIVVALLVTLIRNPQLVGGMFNGLNRLIAGATQ